MPLHHTKAHSLSTFFYPRTYHFKHIIFFIMLASLLLWNNGPALPVTLLPALTITFTLPYQKEVTIKPIIHEEAPLSESLWEYLKKGINYLETSGKDVAPGFVHPGGFAFGPLGLSKVAVEDVYARTETLRRYSLEDIFSKKEVYDLFARHYAGLLLKHYLKIDCATKSKEELFQILHKAWFLGPNLYAQGQEVIPSRLKRAQEYLLLTKN